MDAYPIHGDHYYQGYPAQAPPPGTAPSQTLPPGAVPAQPSAPTSSALVPPVVAPSPSSTAASYYGTYAPPSYGYLPSSAERWNSYPIPAAEPHSYASYPPTVPHDRPSYGHGHHPYHQQDPFVHPHSFPPSPQAYMPLPPRGSDVARFRRKRPFLPPQNPRPNNKSFKQPQTNYRGGGKNSRQVKRAVNPDPRAFNVAMKGFSSMPSNAQILHPFWQGRIDEAAANCMGKKRRMDEKGEGRPARNDDRRKGEKRARPGWNKGKRKKGRKQGGDKSSTNLSSEEKGTSAPVKSVDLVPGTEEQAQEAAIWLELYRDVRRKVQEFLHTSERESFQKRAVKDTEDMTSKAAMQQDLQEPTIKTVGGDATAVMKDSQERSYQAAGGFANAEMQGMQVEVGGNSNAEMQDTQEAADGDSIAEMQGLEEVLGEAVYADVNAHMAKNDAASQLDYVDAQCADNGGSLQPDHINALQSDCTKEQQLDHKCAVQSDRADLFQASSHIDAMQSGVSRIDEVNMKQLDIVDILKTDCGCALQLATEIVKNLEVEGVQECVGVDEMKCKHNNQKALLETAHSLEIIQNLDKKHGQHPEDPTQEELKEREEKTFDFFTKLLEENKALRNMYIEKCSNGAFECLMCHSKIKKRFSNLVSLVTHANNVLKTKKLPEHRGYGRAICALFGWDPQKYPKVQKSQVSQSEVENVPKDDERAPLGDSDVCAPVGNAVEHAHAGDAVEDGLGVNAVKCIPVVKAAEIKLTDDVDESSLRAEADEGLHTADAVEGEPVGDADRMEPRCGVYKSAPLCDADKCSLLKDTGGSVDQESKSDNENIVDQGDGMNKELTEEQEEQLMVSADAERVNEQGTWQAGEVDVAKSLQPAAEAVQ